MGKMHTGDIIMFKCLICYLSCSSVNDYDLCTDMYAQQ
jgi:hypothetical protein